MATTSSTPALSRRLLRRLPAGVSVPSYRSDDLRAGIVHLGVGRFHRAHQASYLDQLAEGGVSLDWGVVGVGMRTPAAHHRLMRQDRLFTLWEPGPAAGSLRVVGHLKDALFAPTQRDAVLAALTSPETKVVSLTVTADAYGQPADRADGAFSLVATALDRRRRDGCPPFTVLSCDNVDDNGAAARRQVLSAASRLGDGLASWIEREVSFPSSMVDRITPPLTDGLRRALVEQLGVDDHCAVMGEPFSDWVVEDDFCNDRPPLEQVGVRFVSDPSAHRTAKARLLNGSHCALAHLGGTAGLTTAAEVMADPVLGRCVEELMRTEVMPLLASLPIDLDLESYQESVRGRLASTAITDPLERLRAKASVRIPSYVLPSIHDALRLGTPYRRLTLVVAAWVAHLRSGTAVPGDTDPAVDCLTARARVGGRDLRPLLAHSVFGTLAEHGRWVAELQWGVEMIERRGPRAAAAALTEEGKLHAEAS